MSGATQAASSEQPTIPKVVGLALWRPQAAAARRILRSDTGSPLEHEDPSDCLLDVESSLAWLHRPGFDVNCYWKWLETVLLIGLKPADVR
jgi:hypothetical protein